MQSEVSPRYSKKTITGCACSMACREAGEAACSDNLKHPQHALDPTQHRLTRVLHLCAPHFNSAWRSRTSCSNSSGAAFETNTVTAPKPASWTLKVALPSDVKRLRTSSKVLPLSSTSL